MVTITFPNGTSKDFVENVTIFDIAKSISTSLTKSAIVGMIDGELRDLSYQVNKDSNLRILTPKDPEALEILRHSCAHLMAQSVKELFPDCQITIGPSTETGFYYDFATKKPFTEEDLNIIEEKMREVASKDFKLIRKVCTRDKAVEFFESMGEDYKSKIIKDIDLNQEISLYSQGDFTDLCRGPHVPSTGYLKHFKLMKVAGAYFRGDSKNEMLQRIYGTVFFSKQELDDYLFMLEEAEKRDHRKLGKHLDLFHFQDEAPGMVFWHPNGWSIYRTIEEYIRNKIQANGYVEVKTPILLDKSLWEKSGHWEKFREDMFALNVDDEKVAALKPMNCPCHVQIFKQGIKSYRDLPLRMAEFGLCHRNEASGALHGLMRVRALVQDDAHIFCTSEQINEETVAFCKLLTEVYKDFGFEKITIKFSDRPEKRAGSDEVWDKAEAALKEAVMQAGYEFELNPGAGAFYGPKLEFCLKDSIGRSWQCGTLQVDFVLPERLEASYIDHNGKKQVPVMLHRAILGSFERFIGILIEEYAGKFPIWLAPIQVGVATITSDLNDYGKEILNMLKENKIRVVFDDRADKIGAKIRDFSNQKVPIIVVLGKKEREDKTISIRRFGSIESENMSLDDLIKEISIK